MKLFCGCTFCESCLRIEGNWFECGICGKRYTCKVRRGLIVINEKYCRVRDKRGKIEWHQDESSIPATLIKRCIPHDINALEKLKTIFGEAPEAKVFN